MCRLKPRSSRPAGPWSSCSPAPLPDRWKQSREAGVRPDGGQLHSNWGSGLAVGRCLRGCGELPCAAVASSTPLTLGGQQASGLGGSVSCDRRVRHACTPETSPPMVMPCPGLRGASLEVLPRSLLVLTSRKWPREARRDGRGVRGGSRSAAAAEAGAWGRPVRRGLRRRVSRGRVGPGLEARAVGKRPISRAPPGRILRCKGSDVRRPRAEKPPLPRSVTSPLVSRFRS